jgi:beta-glucanase (GH16 family)
MQAYTEKDNFEIRNSILKIITKPQKVQGKVWSSADGFKTKEFAFTSGLINTGKSFRQKYGTFSAKIKLGDASAKSAFWMLADQITPHIDVCRTLNGKVAVNYFSSVNKKAKASVGSKYANDYFIFTLEWSADKLVWKINNTEVLTQTSDVPQEPMYILFSGGLDKPVNSMTSMEIDWVRVFQPKK